MTSVDALTPTKGERTRQRLLDIAIERFGAEGFRATSVTAIARDAGITQAAVYAYFQNKDDLFRCAVDADARSLIDEALGAVDTVPVRQLGVALLLCALDSIDRHPLARRVLSGVEPDAVVHIRETATLGAITEYVAHRIADGQARGDVRPDVDPAVMADGLEALVISLLTSAVHSATTALDRYLVGVSEAFDAMLRPSPDR